MKGKFAIGSGIRTWAVGLLFLLCGLLSAGTVGAQTPIRIINPAGGGAGDPGLRIEVYADGSYHVYRNGKRETYEGTDKMSWQSTASNIRGPQTYVSIYGFYNSPPDAYANLALLQPTYVSPVFGSGTAADPWKIQLMGTLDWQTYFSDKESYSYIIQLVYTKDNPYYYTDHLFYVRYGNLDDAGMALFRTERLVMGADNTDLTATANSQCAIGYKSGETNAEFGGLPSPSVVSGYRTGNCGGSIPYPRSHVMKMSGAATGRPGNGYWNTFQSYNISDAASRMNMYQGVIVQELVDNMQTSPGGSATGISVEKLFDRDKGDLNWGWEWTGNGIDHPSFGCRMLTGYGTTPNDFDATPVGTVPTTYNSDTLIVGFLSPKVNIQEGNSTQPYTQPMIYIVGGDIANGSSFSLYADLALEVDGVPIPLAQLDGAQNATASDFSMDNGVLIKKYQYQNDTLKIPLSNFVINGNNILQYNRAFKLKLKANYDLIKLDTVHHTDTCRVIIVDDEPRDISLTPLNSTINEGDNPTIRASLPTGVIASAPLTINLHLASLAHTTGFSIPATVTIPALGDHIDFTLTTLADNIIEKDDTLHISADGQILGQNGSSSTDAVFILKDKTRTDPNNLKLTLAPVTTTVDKGLTGQTLTVSLPTGITTAVPINITLAPDAATTADPSSYVLPLQFRIDSGQGAATLNYNTRVDSIVYGPLVKHLVLNVTAKDSLSDAYTTSTQINIGINDKNWPLAHPVVVDRSTPSIDEGNGSARLWVALPDGLVAGRDFGFAISTTSSLTSDQHVLGGMPTDSVHIAIGSRADTFAVVSTPDDGIAGNDETVTFKASANNLPAASNGSTTLNIVDKTVTGPPPTLIVRAVSRTLPEGQSTDLKLTLDSGKTLTHALNVTLSLVNNTTSAGDATLNTTTYTLPANTNSITIINAITANTDAIIEGNEILYVDAVATGANIQRDTLTITDKTRLTPAQTALVVSAPAMPATWTKGDTKSVTISLPAGVTTQVPLTISLAPDAGSEVGASNFTLPAMPLTIPAGATSTTFNITLLTDLEVYGPLTRHLRINGVATDGALPAGAFTVDSVRAAIADNNWPLVHALVISKDTITEGSGTYAASITLPDGLKAGRDLAFNVTTVNSLTTGKHVLSVPAAVTLTKGNLSASLGNYTVPADAYVGNVEDITFAATYTGAGTPANAPVTSGGVHIKDAAATVTISLSASAATLNEGQSSDVTVTLGGGLQLLQPLTITLTPQLAGTLTSGDFTLNTTTLTLPAATNSLTFTNVLTANTDNVLEADEALKLGAVVTSGPAATIADLAFTIKDKTHTIPGAMALVLTQSATTVQKGNSVTLTIALAPPYTTETPIRSSFTWNNTSTTGSTAYTLGSNPVVFSSGSSTTVSLALNTDNIVYGPSLQSLKLNATAADTSGSLTINNVSLTVSDNNWPLAHPLVISSGSITEGGAAYTNTITLPDGLVAGRNLDFTVSNTNGITAGKHILAQPGTITIAKGSSAANIASISVPVDVYVGNDEDVTYAAAYSGGLGLPADAPVTNGLVHITDGTNATLGITLTPATSTLSEDNIPTAITVTLGGGKKLLQPLTIVLTPQLAGTLTSSDFTLNTTTLTLPANTNSFTFNGVLQANSDLVLENTETLQLTASVTGQPSIIIPALNFSIADLTHNTAANVVLNIAPAASTLQKGNSTTLTISLPAGVTTEIPVTINLNYGPASTATSSAYTMSLPNPLTFSSGSGTTVSFQANTDNIVYGPLTRSISLETDAHDAVKTFTINNAVVAITDNNWPLVHPLLISKDTITEGGGATTLKLTLPDNLVAGRNLDFNISNTNGITLGKHIIPQPGTVTIANGSSTANVATISTAIDNYIGNAEDITFSGAYTGTGTAADAPVTAGALHINDGTAANLDLTLTASKYTLDEDNSAVDVTVSINNGIVLLSPLTINLAGVNSGTTTATDYTLLQPTLTLPTGATSKTFTGVVQANSDAVLEGDEPLKIKGSLPAYPAATVAGLNLTIHDLTHNNPANTVITLTPAAPATWAKGDSRAFTVSLPAGITTELPIVLNTAPTAGSQLQTGSYSLPSPITLAGGNNTVVTLQILPDNFLYGPQTEHLQLSGSATDTVFSSYTVNKADLDIADNNYPPAALVLALNAGAITEGGAGTQLTLSLPGSLKAGRDLAFAIKTVSDLTDNTHAIAWPTDSVHFAYGDHSITVALPQAATDKVIGNDENIAISGAATGFTVNGTTLHIADATATDPVTGTVTLVTSAASMLEGGNVQLTASLGTGVTATHDIIINLAANAASTATSADYSLPASITIPAGSNSGSVTVSAATDNIIEPTLLLRIDGSSTGLTVTSVAVNIDDATHLAPANTALQITIDSSSIIKGHSTKVTISFVNTNITVSQAFNITVTADAASTAAVSDYNALPAALAMPAGAGSTSFTLQTLNANFNESTVALILKASAGGYTISHSSALDILTVTPLTVQIVKTTDASEPATDGAFTVQLTGSTLAASDITVTLNIDNTGATANFVTPPTQVTIPAGANSVTVPVIIKDDYILQGDGALTATLQTATSASGSIVVDNTPAVMLIHDDENATTGPKAAARKIVIEKISDARKPAANGSFRIRFADPRVSIAKDVAVQYAASGNATPDADYHALPGTVVIPAFETEVVVDVAPILNNEVFNDVTATFTLSQASSAMQAVTWSISDTASAANILIRDNNGVPDTAMAVIGPNRWTDDTTRKIRVHPALSPNGDGVGNDAMYVENLNKFPENEVTVFNRWGATVFHTRNYDNINNNFAGRYNVNGSGNVPEGTYYYIIIINDNGKRERYTGFVVIRR